MSAAHVHLVLNHVPILGFAFGFLLLSWARWRNSEETARAALALLTVVGLTSIAVFLSGEPAEEIVEDLAGVSHDAIEVHEEFAELAMIVAVVVGLAAGGALVAFWKRTMPSWVMNVALVASFVTFGMMTYTGFQGGQIHHQEVRPEGVPAEQGAEMETEESAVVIGAPALARARIDPGDARVGGSVS